MTTTLAIKQTRLLKGSAAGVIGPTALVLLELTETIEAQAVQRLKSYQVLASLNPGNPHFGVDPDNWVSSFVHKAPEAPGLVHLVCAYVVALQRWAREPVAPAAVHSVSGKLIQLALPWRRQAVLKHALNLTLDFVDLAQEARPDAERQQQFLDRVASFLQSAHERYLIPNTVRFAQAALEREIPLSILNNDTIELGWGKNKLRMKSTFTSRTSTIASALARDKSRTRQLLAANRLPVPDGSLVASVQEADSAAAKLGWPVVVKPGGLDQGIAVTPGICNQEQLHAAFEQVAKLGNGPAIVEKHVPGEDHRMLVVHDQLLMTCKRIPAGVTGDGGSTIGQLIEQTNRDPMRGDAKKSPLLKLKLDAAAHACLEEQGLDQNSTPEQGRFVYLNKTANMSNGGTSLDVSDAVHPDNRAAAIRAARITGLDIAGVDFLCPDISRSYREVGGAICEVNAQPGFRPHWIGNPDRDINGEVLDILTDNDQLRIPTAAITGTNGKSTTARMLHRIWQLSGRTTGVCTTAGTWIGEEMIDNDNLSGLPGARLVLQDPTVESAVMEMPRKGLLVFGQPCDRYDVAALLNIADDHIGVDGINSMEEMARLKAQVIAKATQAVVLNADDPLCMAMRKHVAAEQTILAALDRTNSDLSTHLENNGKGAYIKGSGEGARLILAEGEREVDLMRVADIPATQGALIEHNILNSMWAACLAWAQGLEIDTIRAGLGSFGNTVTDNPGRYNYIEGFPFQLMVDFAHNPDSARTVLDYVKRVEIQGKRILLTQKLGNRHKSDFTRLASGINSVFDQIIVTPGKNYVRQNPEYAGDDPEAAMLAHARNAMLEAGCDESRLRTTKALDQAIDWALDAAQPGDFVLVLSELDNALPFIRKRLE